MTSIKLAKGVDLPLDVVTQAIGILAKRRMGKSYLARRLVEQLFGAGQQVLIVDPKGDWWGVRSSADGKSDGLPIVIFGGERGDVPLEPASGALVARTVVESGASVLLDLSLLRKHEVATFMAPFLEDLYRLKAREQYRTPLAIVIDEADAIAPQKPQPNEARMLGAVQDVVRRGGQRGIGVTLVTQRSAVLSKDVLTQVQILITLRTIAPQDLAAIKAWIDVHGTIEQQKILMASLPSLPVGDAWYWSPGWPTDEGIFARAHTLPITTYDSGATPKPGQKRQEPKSLAAVDLDSIRAQMAETLERVKADDPKTLRARIAELERQLRAGKAEPERVEVPVFDEKRAERLRLDIVARIREELDMCCSSLQAGAGGLVQAYANDVTCDPGVVARRRQPEPVGVSAPSVHRDPKPSNGSPPRAVAGIGKGELVILTAIAQHEDGVTREQLTVLTGYKRSSRDTYLQRLRQNGLIEDGETITVTAVGLKALGPDFEPLPTGDALREHWLRKLPQGERAVLEAVVKVFPKTLDREKLSERTGYKRSSRDTYLQRLGARRLVVVERDGVRASEELFG